MRVHSTEKLVQRCTSLQQPLARVKIHDNEGDRMLLCCYKSSLYTLEESKTRNCMKLFSLMQGPSSNVTAASSPFSYDLLDNNSSVLLSSELYIMPAKREWEWSTRFHRRPAALRIRFDSKKEQKRSEVANHGGVTDAATESTLNSD